MATNRGIEYLGGDTITIKIEGEDISFSRITMKTVREFTQKLKQDKIDFIRKYCKPGHQAEAIVKVASDNMKDVYV